MNGKLELKRDWLFGGYTSRYLLEHNCSLSEQQKAQFAWSLLHKVVPVDARRGKILRNIKGRDPNNLIQKNILSSQLPTQDEIFYLSGTIIDDTEEDEEETIQKSKFLYYINTNFHGFIGNSFIDHKASIHTSGPVPEFLGLSSFLETDELSIDTIRLGLDIFSARRLSFLGLAPLVTQTFLLELNGQTLNLQITAERLATKNELPISEQSLIISINDVLKEIFSFDIEADYKYLAIK
jgi:hypothetical protein